jgi:hypothetical protein
VTTAFQSLPIGCELTPHPPPIPKEKKNTFRHQLAIIDSQEGTALLFKYIAIWFIEEDRYKEGVARGKTPPR